MDCRLKNIKISNYSFRNNNHTMEVILYFEHLGHSFENVNISAEEIIKVNKTISPFIAAARRKVKPNTCLLCGKETSTFCNSHSIPKFCLENIAIKGEVATLNSILKLPPIGARLMHESIGINSSGTFQLICNECDSKAFQNYENPENYISGKLPTQKMLAEIAAKNYLKSISKRLFEIALTKEQFNYCSNNHTFANTSPLLFQKLIKKLEVSQLDLKNYYKDFETAKKSCLNDNNNYYLIYYKVLDYVVPIATQTPISIIFDLEDNIINDVLNKNPNYYLSDLHLCVFPLKNTTAILMFIRNNEKRFRKFYKQFRSLSESDQLAVINYLIILYTEDYYLYKDISQLIDIKIFKDTAQKSPVMWSEVPQNDTRKMIPEFSLKNYHSIPNLLSEEYKI